MSDEARHLLPDLRQTLDTFVAESLRTFLEISRVFPALEKKMADEIDEANAVIEHFFWNLEPGASQGLASRLQSHESSLLENTRTMADILEKDLAQLDTFFQTIGETRRIETQLREIRQLSKDIKVYAINSIVVSAKSGVRGEGYRALSKFFIQFSARSRTQIEDLSNASAAFFSVFDQYERELRDLSTHDADLVRRTRENLTRTFEGLMGSFKEFSRVFHELFERVGANRQAIRNMITRIQVQDILQQQLQHVVQILSAWEQTAPGSRHLPLAHALCDLNARQVAAIKVEVAGLLAGLETSLNDLETNLHTFQEDRTLLFSYMVEPNQFDAAPAVDRLMDRAMATLTESTRLFHESLSHRLQAQSSGESLARALGELEPHFVRFAETTNLFTHMNFIAKKEVAQYDVFRESETSLSRDVMDALSVRMGATLTEAEAFYQRSRSDLGKHLGGFRKSLDHHHRVLEELMHSTKASQETLEQSRTVLRDSLVNISSFAGDLIHEVTGALKGVRRLGHVVEVLGNLENRLTETAGRLKKEIQDGGGAPAVTGAEIAPFIACYSIAMERQIARNLFPDLPPDTGSTSGQVELF